MKNCVECEEEISENSNNCPKCGSTRPFCPDGALKKADQYMYKIMRDINWSGHWGLAYIGYSVIAGLALFVIFILKKYTSITNEPLFYLGSLLFCAIYFKYFKSILGIQSLSEIDKRSWSKNYVPLVHYYLSLVIKPYNDISKETIINYKKTLDETSGYSEPYLENETIATSFLKKKPFFKNFISVRRATILLVCIKNKLFYYASSLVLVAFLWQFYLFQLSTNILWDMSEFNVHMNNIRELIAIFVVLIQMVAIYFAETEKFNFYFYDLRYFKEKTGSMLNT